jgi:hypothetical protein
MNFLQHNLINNNIKKESAEILIIGNKLFVKITDKETLKDIINSSIEMEDYSTYIVVSPGSNNVYIHNGYALTYGSGIRLNHYFNMFFNNGSSKCYYQIDTGCIKRKEINIKSMIIPFSDTKCLVDNEPMPLTEYGDKFPVVRYNIWARYSLILPDGTELKNEEYGKYMDPVDAQTFGKPPELLSDQSRIILKVADALKDESGALYWPLKIKKYDSMYINPLNEDIDDNTVSVKTTGGFFNTDRVKLTKGEGELRLYQYAYTGLLKIKLGYKYYNPWCEYSLDIV